MATRKTAAGVDLHALGARVVSVFGPFDSRTLIEISTDTAAMMFPDGALGGCGRTNVIEAVQRDIARFPKDLAESGLAASAVALAYEIEHPYNSATSKSMCARALQEAMRELRSLAPPEEAKDGIDRLAEKGKKRRAGVAKAPRSSRS